MRLISVIMPTFRRLDMMPTAVRGLFGQKLDNAGYEIITVDNSPEGSALTILRQLQAESPVPMQVLHEPRPGVAHARNAAMAAAKGELIAFLDDDTRAGPGWLQALLTTRDKFDAQMVFGPTIAEAPSANPAHRAFIEQLFTRKGPAQDQIWDRYSGASCSLHVRDAVMTANPPFPEDTNETGGEDDFVFSEAQARGARIAWSMGAVVFEHFPHSRANLAYAYRRSFAFGQGPCETLAAQKLSPRTVLGIIRHMIIGAGQATVFGAVSAVAWPLKLPNRAAIFDNAVRGAGKVLWFRKQRFYGAWLEKKTAPKVSPQPAADAAA
jgi:glycosyltransferase involved in cell wall biosynthesis